MAKFLEILKDELGEAVGFAELAGLRYPVKSYSRWVDEPKLMRGSRIDSLDGYKLLVAKGFKSIVDLREEGCGDVGYGALEAGLNVVARIPILDNTPPTLADVDEFCRFTANAVGCYVHCEAGIGRTGVMCAAYRIRLQKWSPEAALAEALSFGDMVLDQQQFILGLTQSPG